MKKRGFTLIELLAVIVILAIIALIATPMVLNTIDKAKRGSASASAYTYVNGVETSLARYMLNNGGNKYTTGKHTVSELDTDLDISIKGDKPSEGNICIGSNGTVKQASIKINGYVVNYDGKTATTITSDTVEEVTCDEGEVALVGDPILDKANALVYDENGICKTDGSTYTYMGGCYIKGASTNNYVWYNGFMWRIMGINSDNTVRLITDENVTALAYGAANTALTYSSNVGYIHDWLNNYFYDHLNSTKSIIKEGSYFCSETTNGSTLSTGRTTCTSGSEVTTKVGLLTYDEYLLANTKSSYLHIGQYFWTMTPYITSNAWHVNNSGIAHNNRAVTNTYGVRPVINVSSDSTITAGDGSAKTFYVLGENKASNITGTLNEKATSGEYVSLEGKTYRVVSKDSDGVKLILDGFYEATAGTTYTMTYGNNNTFTTSSGIGQKLNGTVLTWLGLSNSDKLVTTTYYQGDGFGAGTTYTDTLKQSNGVEAKVGLIQVGDILASQSSTMLTKNYETTSSYSNTAFYWTMNKYTNTTPANAWRVDSNGNANYSDVTNTFGVRPVIKVNPSLTISGGNGTWISPYQI